MKNNMILKGLFLLITTVLVRGTHSTHSTGTCINTMKPVTKVINSLGSRLQQLIGNHDNYFISPVSISMALAMVFAGARGSTKQHMANSLKFNDVGLSARCLPNTVSESFKELIHSLENESQDNSLLIANGVFAQVGRKISKYYATNLERFFNTKIEFLNFAEEELETMRAINVWVANYTKNKIPKLINEPLDHLTVMVLVNAVYFKGLWDLPFNETATKESTFYGVNNMNKDVQFMHMQDKVHYYFDEEKKYYFIELDYTLGNISMIILLPKNRSEIPHNVVLTSDLLCDLREKFELRSVNVKIPKFKIQYSRELSKDMIQLGMGELFSEGADLSGIAEQENLHVSVMLHKAVIDVNEKGSEAAAISGIGIDGRLKVAQKESFVADHPFLFYIVHRYTDTVIFSGRVTNP